jgi:phenylalanyl-tRNA synthetase beta chain
LSALSLFDRYQGPPLEPGQVSLAYRLTFQPADEPLSDAALDEAISNVTQALERAVGGHIRSGG